MRRWLLENLIKFLLRDLDFSSNATLPQDIEDTLLSQMWESPAFRRRLAERDSKLIYQMAGGEGMAAEPRDTYLIHTGQRVENLLLGRDAKAAWTRMSKKRQNQIDTMAKVQE